MGALIGWSCWLDLNQPTQAGTGYSWLRMLRDSLGLTEAYFDSGMVGFLFVVIFALIGGAILGFILGKTTKNGVFLGHK